MTEGKRPLDLEARRDEDGSYVVQPPTPVREPIDWLAVAWVAVGVAGMLAPVVGVVRCAVRW